MSKTRRSNEPYKRHHWKAARTDRRARFAHALQLWKRVPEARELEVGLDLLEARDQDLAFRRRGGWLTADKSHLRWMVEHGKLDLHHAENPLVERVSFRGMRTT